MPRRPGVQPVHDGGGGGDANGAVSIRAAEHAQPPNETRGFGAQRTSEGVRFVEHQMVQPSAGEQLDILLPGEQQFQLLNVGEQNARLATGCPHRFAGADLFGGIDRLPLAFTLRSRKLRLVVRQ